MLRTELTARVGAKQLARIEPVLRHGPRQDGRQLARKVRDVGTPLMPKRPPIGHFGEAKHLFDAAVAVRRDDEDAPRQLFFGALGEPHDHVVMELSLREVVDDLVRAEAPYDLAEQPPEIERAGQHFDEITTHDDLLAATARGRRRSSW